LTHERGRGARSCAFVPLHYGRSAELGVGSHAGKFSSRACCRAYRRRAHGGAGTHTRALSTRSRCP